MVSYLYVELSLSEALFIECSLQLVFEKRSKNTASHNSPIVFYHTIWVKVNENR